MEWRGYCSECDAADAAPYLGYVAGELRPLHRQLDLGVLAPCGDLAGT